MGFFGKNKNSVDTDKKTEKKVEKKSTKLSVEKKKESMKDLYGGTKVQSKAKTNKGDDKKKTSKKDSEAYRVLIKPLITEKAANLASENKYVFAVAKNSNKIEIAKSINALYGIWPEAVNVIKVSGKKVRYGSHFGKRKDWKKAIVTLPKGSSINIYEGV